MARPRGTQTPATRSLGLLHIARWRPYDRVLCMKFAPRHPPSEYNFDVNHRFLKNMWAPASDFSYSTHDKLYSCKSLPNSDTNDVSVKMEHHLLNSVSMNAQIIQKPNSHLKILSPRRVTCSEIHT